MINFEINQKYIDILCLIEQEFGEIGNLIIEDNYVSLEVYREYYDDAAEFLQTMDKKIKLEIAEKFEDPFFTLCYAIR